MMKHIAWIFASKWGQLNYLNAEEKPDFNATYSSDINNLQEITQNIKKVWNTRNAYGAMMT